MNKQITRIFAALLFTAALAVSGAEAAVQKTTKGDRITVVGNPPAGPAAVAANPHKGPVTETNVVRQYGVDTKKHTVHEEAAMEKSMPECQYVTRRDGANRQTNTVMAHQEK